MKTLSAAIALTFVATGALADGHGHAHSHGRTDAEAERVFYDAARAALVEHGAAVRGPLDDAAYEAAFKRAAQRALDEVLRESATASLN